MDDDEYFYYHAYEDMKDAQQEQVNVMAERLLVDYWQDIGTIQEAIKEGLSENDTYALLLVKYHKENNLEAAGDITLSLIHRYLLSCANQEAENKLT